MEKTEQIMFLGAVKGSQFENKYNLRNRVFHKGRGYDVTLEEKEIIIAKCGIKSVKDSDGKEPKKVEVEVEVTKPKEDDSKEKDKSLRRKRRTSLKG